MYMHTFMQELEWAGMAPLLVNHLTYADVC